MLEIIEPGLFTTVQDAGRPGYAQLGVRRAGAADRLALTAANLLVGNPPFAPALEMTLLGCTFAVRQDTSVGIAGADMEAHVPEEGRALATGASHRLRAGSTLVFGGATDGARTYLALPGGVAAERVLGSAATDPIAGFGGVSGRALRTGDVVLASSTVVPAERTWPTGGPSSGVADGDGPRVVGIVDGPHVEHIPGVHDALVDAQWRVTPRSDRVGIRLDGSAVTGTDSLHLASLPMIPGAIQVPANGLPIVLMPDAPTVGGYPVPAVIAEADQHISGQLRPGDELRFRWIELAEARQRAAERDQRLVRLARTLG